ncbi:MAG: hypothetical protein JXR63_02215 [Spirochaetales bacterium]|nr:hypothetical protein [Spirochaetales bacterium]
MKRSSLVILFLTLSLAAFAQTKDYNYYYSRYDVPFENKENRLEVIDICVADIKDNEANALAYPYICWSASYYGRFNTVIEYYNKMMSVDFSKQKIYSNFQVSAYKNWVRATASEAYLRTGNYKRCIEVGEDYLNGISDYSEGFRVGYAYRIMAESYVALGELHNAVIAYSSAIYYRSDDSIALRGLADTNYKRGLKAVALENYKSLLNATNDSSMKKYAGDKIKQIQQELQN